MKCAWGRCPIVLDVEWSNAKIIKIKTRQHKLAANQQIITRQPTKNIRRRRIDNVEEARLGGSVQRGCYSIVLAVIRCK